MGVSFGLKSNALRISGSEMVKKIILFERSEFMIFQCNELKFSNLICSPGGEPLDLFASFLGQAKNEEPARLESLNQ
ncbi:hypothetical protein [Reichenbachiella ulvae]|uniref:Uncharacterized protein n=1 Tax=Reichenbachiella ulvae TaxID=2980104 RepID=A0ABT3CR13_9BACT|nr:hypothetical protein [Reichenbachiella ulvae]MCV9385929.1 hypothetical protein [Reichenbachiella ulvae]